jgi:hypothetical protein
MLCKFGLTETRGVNRVFDWRQVLKDLPLIGRFLKQDPPKEIPINATCKVCNQKRGYKPSQIRLIVWGDSGYNSCNFNCEVCGSVNVLRVDSRTAYTLVSSGIKMTVLAVPQELEEEHEGADFEESDVPIFCALLEGDGWFELLQENYGETDDEAP